MTVRTIAIGIDPTRASQGARVVKRELQSVGQEASNAERAINRVNGDLSKMPAAARGAREVKRELGGVRQEADAAAKAVDRARDANGRFVGSGKGIKNVNDNLKELGDSVNRLPSSVAAATGALSALSKIVAAIAGLSLGQQFIQMADDATRLESQLRLVTKSSEELASAQKILYDVAQGTRSEFGATVQLYSRLARSAKDLNMSQGQVARVTELINKTFVISGASAQEASNAIRQLAQGLAAGALRGDEFNSVAEQAPRLLQVVADSLGKTTGQIREMAAEGKITAGIIIESLAKSGSKIDEEFGLMAVTVGDSFIVLRNSIQQVVAAIDKALGITSTISNSILGLSGVLDSLRANTETVKQAALLAGVAMGLAFGPTAVSAVLLLARTLATTLVGAVGSVIMALGPITASIIAIIGAAYIFRDTIKQVFGVDVVDVILDTANAITNSFAAAFEDLKFVWNNFPAVMQAIGANAANAFLAVIEWMVNAYLKYIQTIIDSVNDVGASISGAMNDLLGTDLNFTPLDIQLPVVEFERFTVVTDESRKSLEEHNKKIQEIMQTDRFGALRQTMDGTKDATTDLSKELDKLPGSLDKAGESAAELEKQLKKFKTEATGLTDKFFPGEAAAAEAAKLTESLKKFGDQLTAIQRSAVENEIANLTKAASLGLRDMDDSIRTVGEELRAVGDVGKDALGGIVDILYESGDVAERLLGLFANIGKKFAEMGFNKLWESIQGGRSIFDFGSTAKNVSGNSAVQAVQAGREIGATIAPVISDNLNSTLNTYAAAVRKIESGSYAGNYSAQGPIARNGDRAYGAYQVMGNNISSWTKQVLGQSLSIKEFLADSTAQDKVFLAKFSESANKFGTMADATSVWFSGRPVNRAGNSSDGYNTVPQYLAKVEAAAEAYNGGIRKGVSEGIGDAARKAQQSAPQQQAPGVAGKGMNLEGLFGVGSAAIGAFAGGYQSGSPLMGGISGAMTGLGAAPALASLGFGAAAGPVGLIGGAIIGLIGGIFGKSKQKKQQLQQAQQELESQMGAITELMASATGNFMGSFEKQFSSITDEFQKAITMAEKAKNNALKLQLEEAMGEFFNNLTERWNRGFEGMIDSLESGQGFEGAFIAGMDAVEKMRESLVGFVNDAKFFDEANGDLAKMYGARRDAWSTKDAVPLYRYQSETMVGSGSDARYESNPIVSGYLDLANQMVDLGVQAFTSTGAQLYATLEELKRVADAAGLAIDDLGKVTVTAAAENIALADSVERARKAAVTSALAMLTGADEFTAIEEAIQKLQGTAANLPSLLDDLGVSADDAAKMIESSLLEAMNKLRDDFSKDLDRSVTSLSGRGYLNEITDALEVYEERLKDTAALGLDSSAALVELNLSVADIASSATLTEQQLKDLATAMPQFAEIFNGLITIAAADKAVEAAQAAKDKAESDLRAAYDADVSRIEGVISSMKRLQESLKSFKDGLKLDAQLSPLSPLEKMLEAQRQYDEVAAKAAAGDEVALGKLEDVSRSYLTEARAYYGSSIGYYKIWEDVNSTLDKALEAAGQQITDSEKQLIALEEQVSVLIDIDAGVKTVAEAILNLNNAILALADAEDARDAAGTPGGSPGAAYAPFITALYKEILNRAPDTSGAAYYTQMMNRSDMTLARLREIFIANAQPELERGYALFSSGGYTGDGGINDIAGMVHGREFVTNASATARYRPELEAMNNGSYSGSGGGDAAMVTELRSLREEVRTLTRATVASGQSVTSAVEGTSEAVTTLGREQRTASLRR